MPFPDDLAAIRSGSSLAPADAAALFAAMLDGTIPADGVAVLLAALAERGETATELTALAEALRARALPFSAPSGAIDVCGTGGDGRGTANISTAVALVVAACGVPVVKHGNRAVSGISGSADVLAALGVKMDAAPDVSRRALNETGICFLFAPHYHPAMRHVAEARRMLGRRTIFNLAGPLANPARVKRQLLGVYAKDRLMPMAETLRALGTERAWVVHSRDGMDEISTLDVTDGVALNSPPLVGGVRGGVREAGCDAENSNAALSARTPPPSRKQSPGLFSPAGGGLDRAPCIIAPFTIDPAAHGLRLNDPDALKGGDAAVNAAAIMALLHGETGALHDIVILNAAAALAVAERCGDLHDGLALAADAIKNGGAARVLAKLAAITNGTGS